MINPQSHNSSKSRPAIIGLMLFLLFMLTTGTPGQQRRPAQKTDDSGQYLSRIQELLQQQKLVEAEESARQLIAKSPRNAMAHNLLGVILDQQNRGEDAEKQYRESLKIDSKFVPALANLGVLLARTSRRDQAIETLELVMRLAPRHPQATYNLGSLYSSKGDYKRAIPLLEHSAGLKPGEDPGADADLPVLLILTDAYLRAGETRKAGRLIDYLERVAGDNPRVLFTLGLGLAAARDYLRAVDIFEKTNKLRPQTPEVLYNLGQAYFNLDRLEEAQAALGGAATLRPDDPEALYRFGLVTSARGQSELALQVWIRAIELKPVFPECNFMIAEEYLKNRRIVKAVEYYEKAVRQDSSQLIYQIRYGAALFRRREYDKAMVVFAGASSKFPQSVDALYLTGYAARAAGFFDEAIVALNRAREMQPDNSDVLANLGAIFVDRGQYQEAEPILKKAIELDQKNFPAHYDLGRMLVRLKRFDDAVPVLERGADINNADPGIHYQLFTAYTRLRRKDDADKQFALFRQLEDDRKKKEGETGGAATRETVAPVTRQPDKKP
ncbi:MAG: tetratricopeptide repeat protein [Acidobacteria bacterium]|nr:tetratricopeptide repeat protein [Acidobacteriota bacterium]